MLKTNQNVFQMNEHSKRSTSTQLKKGLLLVACLALGYLSGQHLSGSTAHNAANSSHLRSRADVVKDTMDAMVQNRAFDKDGYLKDGEYPFIKIFFEHYGGPSLSRVDFADFAQTYCKVSSSRLPNLSYRDPKNYRIKKDQLRSGLMIAKNA